MEHIFEDAKFLASEEHRTIVKEKDVLTAENFQRRRKGQKLCDARAEIMQRGRPRGNEECPSPVLRLTRFLRTEQNWEPLTRRLASRGGVFSARWPEIIPHVRLIVCEFTITCLRAAVAIRSARRNRRPGMNIAMQDTKEAMTGSVWKY